MSRGGEPLTDQQRRVFRYVKRYIREQGYAPLYREIQQGVELSNVGLVYKNLQALEKKGYIHKQKNTKRGITLTDIGRDTDIGAVPGQLNLFEE